MATCKFLFRQKISTSVQRDSLESLVLTHSGAWCRHVTRRKQVGESWQCITGMVWVRCLFVCLGDGELRKPGQQGCSWQFSCLLERCGHHASSPTQAGTGSHSSPKIQGPSLWNRSSQGHGDRQPGLEMGAGHSGRPVLEPPAPPLIGCTNLSYLTSLNLSLPFLKQKSSCLLRRMALKIQGNTACEGRMPGIV